MNTAPVASFYVNVTESGMVFVPGDAHVVDAKPVTWAIADLLTRFAVPSDVWCVYRDGHPTDCLQLRLRTPYADDEMRPQYVEVARGTWSEMLPLFISYVLMGRKYG